MRPPKWCAGCAREIAFVGRWTEVGAPEVTWVLSVRPNGCNHPNSAIPRTRGVEDAAPYGREENHGIRIVANKRIDAANVRPPLGSPERGAVAARRAVTEGLVPAWVQCNNVARQPTQPHPVWAGFHARPASVNGQRRTPVALHAAAYVSHPP